jgi:branched-chain amino acid transport system permease protein
MESAVNATFEIPSFGAVIGLVVLGLGIIADMMGIFNFAHGEFVLLCACLVAGAAVVGVLSAALPWAVAPVLADVVVFVIAIIFVKRRPRGLIV